MIRVLLQMLGDPALIGVRIAWRGLEVLEELERPSLVPVARRWRIAAFCFFAITGLLAVPAAMIHTMIGECHAFNMCGYGALIALGLCILCGIRYGELNRAGTGRLRTRVRGKLTPHM